MASLTPVARRGASSDSPRGAHGEGRAVRRAALSHLHRRFRLELGGAPGSGREFRGDPRVAEGRSDLRPQPGKSIEFMRRHGSRIGRDPIIAVHDLAAMDKARTSVSTAFGCISDCCTPHSRLCTALQNFTRFLSTHRQSADLEAEHSLDLRAGRAGGRNRNHHASRGARNRRVIAERERKNARERWRNSLDGFGGAGRGVSRFEIDRRQRKLHEIFDVLDADDAEITARSRIWSRAASCSPIPERRWRDCYPPATSIGRSGKGRAGGRSADRAPRRAFAERGRLDAGDGGGGRIDRAWMLGTPFLFAGVFVLVPGGPRLLSRWAGRNPPKIVRIAMRQIGRFLDDLERRYPRRGAG